MYINIVENQTKMAEKQTNDVVDNTTIAQVDLDIDDLFSGAVSAANVTTAAAEEKEQKPNVLSNTRNVDMSFLEDDATEEDDFEESDDTAEDTKKQSAEDILSDLDSEEETEDQEEPKKRGRKKIEGIADVFSKLIEDELIIPFDDDKDLDEYTAKDWQELIQANLEEKERKVKEQTPKEFFETLPEELQIAAKYVADGGTDLKGLFGALAMVEETRDLDVSDEYDQEIIVKEYLQATGFGTIEEIQEEIDTWKDLGKLGQQASKFKPKLDKMQEQVIVQRLQEQESRKQQQEAAAQNYMDNVYEALKEGDLNGIKLDKKTQSLLYSGLVQPNYPSVSGKKTNMLGHLLEKYQFVEPNYSLISEALWLLSDPDSYREKIREQGKTKAVEKTVRQLKTEQAKRSASSAPEEKEQVRGGKGLSRPGNIFKRF